jgi:transglutaminase-like putative cysteine protease
MKNISGLAAEKLPANWVQETAVIDFSSDSVQAFATDALAGLKGASDTEVAVRLFEAVRDDIRYDPYQLSFVAADYQASHVACLNAAYCVPKAILLTACLRFAGISAGMGFADVKNHLNSPKLAELMETDLFMYHGYVALRLGDDVFKVTPTFNRDLCDRFGVRAIEFDGTKDALFHEFDADKRKHMEYVNDRGIFENPPIKDILQDMGEFYTRMKALRDSEQEAQHDPDFAA